MKSVVNSSPPMPFNPKVTIVIPVYNGSDYLREAIDSALAQIYSNIEIVVVNDGSNDDGATEQIALSYGARIRYYSKENGGVASALNLAIEKMAGDYFSWLSHDDLYYPDKIDSQIQMLSGMCRHRTILYGNHALFFENHDMGREVPLPGVSPGDFRYFITVSNSLHGCTLLIPKTAFSECGIFNEKLRTVQDYDLWFRMAGKYNFVHVPRLLVKFRQHLGQGTVKMQGTVLIECNKLLSGFVAELSDEELTSSTGKSVSLSYAEIARSMLQRGFGDAAQHAIRLAMKHIRGGSAYNAFQTLLVLLSARVIHAQVRLLRTSYVWFRFIHPLKNRLSRFGIRSEQIKDCRPEKVIMSWKIFGLFAKYFIKKGPMQENTGLNEKFSRIYYRNTFGGKESRSGEGSNLIQTAAIRREIPLLIKEFGIRTFLDAPCGDWFWMKKVQLGVDQYTGIDIVEILIKKNQREFGSASTTFLCRNLVEDPLPQVDMIFCRDCLVHLTFEDIRKVIANFKRSKSRYLLTTTFTNRVNNADLVDRVIWRPLNLELSPFTFPKPLRLINERCSELEGQYTDKHLGLWLLDDIA